jgi:hypothetical protein
MQRLVGAGLILFPTVYRSKEDLCLGVRTLLVDHMSRSDMLPEGWADQSHGFWWLLWFRTNGERSGWLVGWLARP